MHYKNLFVILRYALFLYNCKEKIVLVNTEKIIQIIVCDL